MREIGGYFELECGNNIQYHKNSVLLNSARNALRYIIRIHNIKHLYVPEYTCPVVWDSISEENCKYSLYKIDSNFLPTMQFDKEAYILYNNYFGVCAKQVMYMLENYPNTILDNAQAFFSKIYANIGNIYSPRKFFGLPDGGIVVTSLQKTLDLETDDSSINLMSHLLKRIEYGAEVAYNDFQRNDKALEYNEVKYMSKLTQKLMGNIDYESIKKKRLNNYYFLYNNLGNTINNTLLDDDIPMVYPYITNDMNLRDKLIKNKIFVATYWPNINEQINFKTAIIPLPIDQRYDIDDMKHIVSIIKD